MNDNLDISSNEDYIEPSIDIVNRELDVIILKMGSLLSILNNKKINQAKLLITILKDEQFRKCFLHISEIDNIQLLITTLIEKYPSLCTSKVVFSAVGRINGTNKRRKKSV